MNHPIQFARSITPRVAAKAADARPSLLPASAATSIIHDQRDDHRRAGQPVWGRDDHLPVRVNLFREQDLPERLGRRHFAGGPFGLSGGCSRRLAINHALSDCTHHRVAKGLPSHFTSPRLYALKARDGGLRSVPKPAGEFPEGQGERQHVSCV